MIRTTSSRLFLAVAFGVLLAHHTTAAQAVELPAGLSPILHLDAFDPLGTGVQAANGSVVSSWQDLSGNGNHATVTSTPAYLTGDGTTIGGQPSMRYDVTDGVDYHTTASGFDNTSTIFSVSKLNGGSNARLITSTTVNWLLGYHTNSEDTGFNGDWFGGITGATADPHMYIAEFRTDGSDVLYDGSTLIGNTREPPANGNSDIGILRLGGNGGENSNGDVSEILIFDSDMSQQDFDAAGLYLAQKYGFEAFGHDGEVLGGGPTVPEPSSVVLAILGILGLAATARRRRRRAAA